METSTHTLPKTQKFIKVETLDPSCRCCGRGKEHTCDACQDKLEEGYAFLLECTDSSVARAKRLTGFAVMVRAKGYFENKEAEHPMEPGIYFIRKSDLKAFLHEHYNRLNPAREYPAKFLNSSPRRAGNHTNPAPARSTHQATLLPHG